MVQRGRLHTSATWTIRKCRTQHDSRAGDIGFQHGAEQNNSVRRWTSARDSRTGHERFQHAAAPDDRYEPELAVVRESDFGGFHEENSVHYPVPVLIMKKLILALLIAGLPQKFTLRTETEVVLVNVSVRDNNGNFVRDLKKEDFTLLEDGKPQEILSIDTENSDNVVTAEAPPSNLIGTLRAPANSAPAPPPAISENDLKDRRLIVLFFDLTSMQPEEIERAAKSALQYTDKQMAPADIVSVVTLSNSLTVNLDFTTDKEQLKTVLTGLDPGAGPWDPRGRDTGDAKGAQGRPGIPG